MTPEPAASETPMTAITLLAEAVREVPVLATIPWKVDGQTGTADLYIQRPKPDALKLVNQLHDAGWRRNGELYARNAWTVRAELERDGAALRIEGMTSVPPENERDAIPYFAPLPPLLRRGKNALAEYREWERKCLEWEW
jgi:hypothetical protein